MSRIPADQLVSQLEWRYGVKIFDSTKKISDQDWEALKRSLILTPSSYNLQPWRFLVITDPEIKKKLTPLTYFQKQVESCSHYVVLCAREKISEEDVQDYLELLSEVRGTPMENLEKLKKGIHGDILTGERSKIAKEWATRQVYIAVGNLMTSAALLGIDSCTMEGFQAEKYDEALGLKGTGFVSVLACALGFRHPEDKYSQLPKVRFPEERSIVEMDKEG